MPRLFHRLQRLSSRAPGRSDVSQQPFVGDPGKTNQSSAKQTASDTMSNDRETLEALSQHYQTSVPSDLREAKSFNWYLDEVTTDPRIARNAHQRVADMFDHYGTEYDDDGVVEYVRAAEDPLHDGENVFYGREVHESIHEFVNKVKSGARGLGPEKRIKLL